MKKQYVLIGIVALLVTVGFSGCSSTKDKLIGTWGYERGGGDYDYDTYTFYNNGSVHAIREGTPNNYTTVAYADWWDAYTLAENKLIIGSSTYDFSFSDDNQKLILDGVVYYRQ
jgi:hypothetical protein